MFGKKQLDSMIIGIGEQRLGRKNKGWKQDLCKDYWKIQTR